MGTGPELLSVDMVWEGARHCAFTDLARFKGHWLLAFREASSHMLCPGKIRLLASEDGRAWESAALVDRRGVDFRDPKLCRAPGGRLDLLFGASPIKAGRYAGRSTLVCRSSDGLGWDDPRSVTGDGDWLWRAERFRGSSWGISYRLPSKRRWTVHLMESESGLEYRERAALAVPGLPSEATLRFRGEEAIALVRRESGKAGAWIGRSRPPYSSWTWREAPFHLGGPNFLVLPDGRMLAAGRIWKGGSPRVALLSMTPTSLAPILELPSGGDCGYPGMVLYSGELWLSYYSSHGGPGTLAPPGAQVGPRGRGGRARIYLARIRL